MNLTGQQKCLILAIAVLLLLYFMNKDKENYEPNLEHMTQENPTYQQETVQESNEIVSALDELISESAGSTNSSGSESASDDEQLMKKMLGKNHAKKGKKLSNYSAERPSNNADDALDDFFMRGNSVTNVDNFRGPFKPSNDKNASGDSFAPYQQGKQKKQSTKDTFDLDNYLPQQVNADWFDNVPEPISVKNRHLINISKQVGVNTIGSSHKNASHDIRGDEYCPKFVVSPWMQSSVEPDTSLVGMCGRK